MDAPEAQARLAEIVDEIRRLDARLGELATALPTHAEEDRMLEGAIPPDAATEIRGAISYCREDQIRQLIEYLGAAARASDESLRRDFAARRSPGGSAAVH